MYLRDNHLLQFLKNCAQNLEIGTQKLYGGSKAQRGLMFVKENVKEGISEVDHSDNSIMRSQKEFKRFFEKAGLEILYDEV
jgi:hypothetical protein